MTFTVTPEISVPADNDGTTDLVVTATVAVAATEEIDATKLQTAAESPEDITFGARTATWDVEPNESNADASDRTLEAMTISFPLGTDLDAEDERITVTFTVAGTGYFDKGESSGDITFADDATPQHITINDTDDQEFVWEVTTAKPNEKGPIAVTLTADPTPVELSYVTALRVDTTGYSVSPSSYVFADAADASATPPHDGDMATLSITTPNPDKNRDTDTIMLEATVAGTASSRVPALEIEVADIHALPMADKISAMAFMDDGEGKKDKDAETMSVMEGGDPVHVTVTVDRGTSGYPDDEPLEVSVMASASQALDYRVDPAMITIAKGTGEKSATFKLWALADDDVGAENLMLTLTAKGAKADDNGSGEVMQMFSIAIEDDTMAKVWAKDGAMEAVYGARDAAAGDDKMINPGENFEVMTDALFGHLPTVTVDYAASSDNAAVGVSASGDKIMVMPQDMEGTAKITITATATDKASSFQTSQTRSDVARVMFEVDVVMAALSVMVTADPMEIMEGGMSTITAMASREVTAKDGEVKVDLQVVGDGELSASSITIAAGEMMGTATVTAMEDDEDYEDETLTVVATGAGNATLTIMVTDNDEAPAPPEPTNAITAKSSDDIYPLLMAAGLAGDDAMFHPGMMAELDASMMFDVMEGYSASYSAESDAMNVASTSTSGSMVTVTAGEAGMANVVITGTATMASGVKTGQPATNVATVTFPVNVMAADLVLTLSGPDDMNIVEGGMGGMVTVTANRAVSEDMTVMIMRDRAASSAGDDDYTLDPEMITIKADEMMGSAMVMAVEDEMMENVDNMPEELVLYAMAGDMEVMGTAKLYIWDAAVPALPIIAQLLLAFFLAIGGYRRYLRR